MDTIRKLDEAKYLLDLLSYYQKDETKFSYNLNAFLSSWRSVLDIMLYDFAEHYSLGFTREVEMNDKEFYAVAQVLKRTEAVKFIKWWRQKQGILRNEPLWRKRDISFHRGSLGIIYHYYGYGTGSSSGTISYMTALSPHVSSNMGGAVSPHTVSTSVGIPFWSFLDFQNENLIDKCKEGYAKLEEIVHEAETIFSVSL